MSNISSKISSIEENDKVKSKSIHLRPADDDILEIPKSNEIKPEAPIIPTRSIAHKTPDPLPDFITRSENVRPDADAPEFGWVRWTVVFAVLLWLASTAIIAYGFFDFGAGLWALSAVQWSGLALFILGPILLILLGGYALKKLAEITTESYFLAQTTERLMSPDETTVSRTSIMSQSIRREVEEVNAKIDAALSRMSTLQDTLETQVAAINQTTHAAENRTEIIATRLAEERTALTSIATTFEDRMNTLSSMLDEHSNKLAKSTHEAEQKIQEARISVEGATAKINAASEIVRGNTIDAAQTLETNQSEISKLGEELKTRATELDAVYRKHASDLSAMISDLRDEQENLGSSLEARLQKMRDMSLSAQVSAEHLSEASESGRKTVEALADAARLTDSAVKKRFSEMEEMVRYSNSRAEKISETATRRVQDSLAQTRKEIARIEADMGDLQSRLNTSSAAAETLNIEDTDDEPVIDLRRTGNEPEENNRISQDYAQPQSGKVRLKGLRPAPDKEPDFAPAQFGGDPEELIIPPADPDPAPEPTPPDPEPVTEPPTPVAEAPLTEPILDAQPSVPDISEPDDDSVSALLKPIELGDGSLELSVEVPEESDLVKDNPDAELTSFDPDLLRRAVPDDKPKRVSKSTDGQTGSWWKNLFAKSRDEGPSALDQLTAPNPPPSPPSPQDMQPTQAPSGATQNSEVHSIIPVLSALGLSPMAVVDDGCIIEALNARVSKGPMAMSEVVQNRLSDPIKHLYLSAQADASLKEALIEYARDFHISLKPIENNREFIRNRFETEMGRAFLLCDAALNVRV